jgi:hypothetical protein
MTADHTARRKKQTAAPSKQGRRFKGSNRIRAYTLK